MTGSTQTRANPRATTIKLNQSTTTSPAHRPWEWNRASQRAEQCPNGSLRRKQYYQMWIKFVTPWVSRTPTSTPIYTELLPTS
eukprot:15826_4